MPRPLARQPPPSRYSYSRVTEEIALQLSRHVGRGSTALIAKALRMDSQQVSHRMRGVKCRFSIEQIGVIADELGMPAGWPFIQAHISRPGPRQPVPLRRPLPPHPLSPSPVGRAAIL